MEVEVEMEGVCNSIEANDDGAHVEFCLSDDERTGFSVSWSNSDNMPAFKIGAAYKIQLRRTE